jgi:hypothetical protein
MRGELAGEAASDDSFRYGFVLYYVVPTTVGVGTKPASVDCGSGGSQFVTCEFACASSSAARDDAQSVVFEFETTSRRLDPTGRKEWGRVRRAGTVQLL